MARQFRHVRTLCLLLAFGFGSLPSCPLMARPADPVAVAASEAASTPAAAVMSAERLREFDQIELMAQRDFKAALARVQALIPQLVTAGESAAQLRASSLECRMVVENDPTRGLELAEQGILLSRSRQAPNDEAEFRLCRGIAREYSGKLVQGMEDYDAAVTQGARTGDRRLQAMGLDKRGSLRSYLGDHARALPDLQLAYQLFTQLGLDSRMRGVLSSIASAYIRVGEYDKALKYFHQQLEEARRANLPVMVADAEFSIGRAYEERGDYAQALEWFDRSHATASSIDDAISIAYADLGAGMVHVELGHPAEGLTRLKRAEKVFQASDDREMLARVALGQGKAQLALGEKQAGLQQLQRARGVFESSGNDRYLSRALAALAPALAAQGDYAAAYAASHQLSEVLSALQDKERLDFTARLRIQFDSDRTEHENAVLQREKQLVDSELVANERVRGWQTLAIVLGGVLLALLAVLVRRQFRLARQMQALALTDELTGLPNRRHIVSFGDQQLALQPVLSVLVFDVDHFKRINDGHGHAAGDRVLKRLAQVCQQALRQHDRVGRTGGEEFLVVLPTAPLAVAARIAEKLRGVVEATRWDDIAVGLRVTISVGVAQRTAAEHQVMKTAQRADDALYRAKLGGRNRIELDLAEGQAAPTATE